MTRQSFEEERPVSAAANPIDAEASAAIERLLGGMDLRDKLGQMLLGGFDGTSMTTEAMKLIAGIGESLVGRLLMLDGKFMEWTGVKVARNAACPVCATRSSGPNEV